MRRVFFYGDGAVAAGIPPALVGVPHIIDEDGQPHLEINEYLLARRNGDWAGAQKLGGLHAEVQGSRVLRTKVNYLRTRAYQLDSFRRWCRAEGLRPVAVAEKALDQYAEDLEEGLVTGFEGGILPQSVNQHLTAVIDFLQFAAARQWRDALGLTVNVHQRSRTRSQVTKTFAVMRRANPAELQIWYTEADILNFIGEFETAPGKLSAKIMYGTGLRIAEVLSLKVNDIPTLEAYKADPAKRYLTVVGKYDKRRRVPFTESLIRYIHRFIDFDRRRYASKLLQASDQLIIGPSLNGNAAPTKPRALQKEFVRAREASQKSALTAHLLRHHFAAHYLLRSWQDRKKVGGVPTAFEMSMSQPMLSHELILLKEALGHSRLETTCGYLKAVGFLSGSDIPDTYLKELSDE